MCMLCGVIKGVIKQGGNTGQFYTPLKKQTICAAVANICNCEAGIDMKGSGWSEKAMARQKANQGKGCYEHATNEQNWSSEYYWHGLSGAVFIHTVAPCASPPIILPQTATFPTRLSWRHMHKSEECDSSVCVPVAGRMRFKSCAVCSHISWLAFRHTLQQNDT